MHRWWGICTVILPRGRTPLFAGGSGGFGIGYSE
jgi:hypothetical protein